MTELYSQSEISAVRRRLIRWRVIAAIVVCAALACCVYLALAVTTATEGRNRVVVIITSAVAGWALFYIINYIVLAARRELAHASMLASEPSETVTGRITGAGKPFRIRRSISVAPIFFEDAEGDKRTFNVSANMAKKLLSAAGEGAVTLRVVHRYVAGFGPADGEGGGDK